VTDLAYLRPSAVLSPIAVLRPRLPSAEALLPWLRQMDASGIYSNNGPLNRVFGSGLAALYGVPDAMVMPVASGTAGLISTLLALRVEAGTLCMVPSWTFAATGHAARAAGLAPWLVDVEEQTGMLTPDMAEALLAEAPGPVGAVMPVVPFGMPFPYAAWEEFQERTGVPVVIDAAAAFDTLKPCAVPAVVSLHATKLFGVGEGGFVACTRAELLLEVERAGNFGFYGSRIAAIPATNGKLSELHACVGLAGLEAWAEQRRACLRVCSALAEALSGHPGVALQPGWGQDWISSTCIVRCDRDARSMEATLAANGIETRRWWGHGLHQQPAFTACPRTDLPVTDRLARQTIGLPCHLGLSTADIVRIRAHMG
jgi:dTDP-4-amino-4,6-dideoxygalactose transaminase